MATKVKIGIGRHASSIKRDRQDEKRKTRNHGTVAAMRTAIKKVRQEPTKENLDKAVPMISKISGNFGIPHNRADRIISRLTRAVNKAQ
jgi:ribosomal protein S20